MKFHMIVVCIIRKGLASFVFPVWVRLSVPAQLGCLNSISISYFCLIYTLRPFVSLPLVEGFAFCDFALHCPFVMMSHDVPKPLLGHVTPSKMAAAMAPSPWQFINLRDRCHSFWFLVLRLKPIYFALRLF